MKTTLPANAHSVIALEFYRSVCVLLTNLWARWQDEKGHEDIADYQAKLQQHLDASPYATTVQLVGKLTGRPFAVDFACDGRIYRLYATTKGTSYNRIA